MACAGEAAQGRLQGGSGRVEEKGGRVDPGKKEERGRGKRGCYNRILAGNANVYGKQNRRLPLFVCCKY